MLTPDDGISSCPSIPMGGALKEIRVIRNNAIHAQPGQALDFLLIIHRPGNHFYFLAVAVAQQRGIDQAIAGL